MTLRRGALLGATLAAALAFAGVTVVRASDHLDGPRVTADPQADLTDVFAFTSPEDPARVVLAMAVVPFASDAATFAPEVDYAFRVRRVTALRRRTAARSWRATSTSSARPSSAAHPTRRAAGARRTRT